MMQTRRMARPVIASVSLGRASVHSLAAKLDAAQRHGFDIELFYEDLEHQARLSTGSITEHSLIAAAKTVRSMCDNRGLTIICLQPFMHYEGLLDRVEHAQRIAELTIWIRASIILGTRLINIASSFLPADKISCDRSVIVADLQDVADSGLEHGMSFSYEALCWSTHINTWQRAWDIVQAVDRPNFGLCLDTFNIAGKTFANPALAGGTEEHGHDVLAASLTDLSSISLDKLFLLQVADAERLAQPLAAGHALFDETQPAHMTWSRNFRLFYGEHELEAYLPVDQILQTILCHHGYRGTVSFEVFHACLLDARPDLPEHMASRAAVSWHKLKSHLHFASDLI